jgi:membrane-bound lytic murein transglycosylase
VVGVLDAGFKADGEGLLLAVTYGNAKMVAAMLAKNVLMNCHHDGKCPVQMAVFQRHKNILQMLLQHLRDKHETERFTQRSAFQIAQAGKLDDYVQLLRAYPDVADLREDKLPKYKAPLLISQPSAAAQPLLPHPPRSELRRRIPGPGLKMEM